MKLISCHIENFGKIHDYSMDFTSGTNVICQNNGWGKSTFAAFIRAMFYGLEGERKKSLEENERKRYKPWQGGIFGGQLTFEIEGKKYIISRIFGDKDANDECEIRDANTNLITEEYGKDIGEHIFKIGRESFSRTIFIGQSDCDTKATDDINAKIGNLTDNTNDLNSYETANNKLVELLNSMNPKRTTGSLNKRKSEIAECKTNVKNGQSISQSIEEHQQLRQTEQEKYKKIKEDIKIESGKQEKASQLKAEIANLGEWERLKKAVDSKKIETQELKKLFHGKVPDINEVKEKINTCGELNTQKERVSNYFMSDKEKEDLLELSQRFENEVPDEASIDEILNKTSEYNKIIVEQSSEQMSGAEKERFVKLEPCFEKENEKENISLIIGKWNERNSKKSALLSKKDTLETLKANVNSQKSQKNKISIMMVIGLVVIMLGLILAIQLTPIVGVIIVIIGIILVCVGIIGNKGKQTNVTNDNPKINELQKSIDEDIECISQTDLLVANYLKQQGKTYDENLVNIILQEIMAEAIEYSGLKTKNQKAINSIKKDEIEKYRKSISEFISKYRIVPDASRYSNDLYAIKDKVKKYKYLIGKNANYENANGEKNNIEKEIKNFLQSFGYEVKENLLEQLNEIKDNIDNYTNAIKNQRDAESALADFEEKIEVSKLSNIGREDELPTLEIINQNLEQLNEEQERVHQTITRYNQILDGFQEKYEAWEESRSKLSELEAIQEEEQRKYDYILLVQKKLGQAKEAITAKYSAPILEGFSKYYALITEERTDRFYVDANINITLDELGKQRDINTQSNGYKDLIAICLRLALVDAMYQEEKPVLVLDDPFTNLDDNKIVAAKGFMDKVAEEYQIVYFTCSNSRTY